MQHRNAQYAMEYMVVMAFALLALIPVLLIYGTEKSSMESKVNANQVTQVARKITDSAESVYYLGSPSKTTLKVYMPSNVINVTISGKEIIFKVNTQGGVSDIVAQSEVNLSGSISGRSGIRYITIAAQENDVYISD
jgi:hypothetical protein